MQTHVIKRAAFVLFIAVFALTACNKNPYPGFKKFENGVYMQYHTSGAGEVSPQVNDYVTLDMIYRLADTTIFNSTLLLEPLEFPVIQPTFEGDLYAALTLLKSGDSVTVVFPADSFFMVMAGMPQSPDFVTPGEPIYFDIHLREVRTAEEVKAEQQAFLQEMKMQEQEVLQAHLEDNGITTPPQASGLYYIEDRKGAGPLPKVGDVVKVHFIVSMIEGFPLFSTYEREPLDVTFGEPFDTQGFDEAIGLMRKGTKARLIVPSHLAFDSIGQGQMIPPYTTLLYDVEVVSIKSKEDAEKERQAAQKEAEKQAEKARIGESAKINNYLQRNGIDTQPTPSGMYYIENEKGTGKKAENGKTVKVHYTLYNIEGKQLQSSKEMGQPFSFTLGQGQVIKGWDEGLLLMQEGGKATFVLPSSLAYGAQERGEDIPAYAPLVFDVELIEVVD